MRIRSSFYASIGGYSLLCFILLYLLQSGNVDDNARGTNEFYDQGHERSVSVRERHYIRKGLVGKPNSPVLYAPSSNESVYFDEIMDSTCILPQLNPYDASVVKLINPTRLPNCTTITEKIPKIGELRGGYYANLTFTLCESYTYRSLLLGEDEKRLKLGPIEAVQQDKPLKGDLLEVTCKVRPDTEWSKEVKSKLGTRSSLIKEIKSFHAQIYEDAQAKERALKASKYKSEKPLNILFIGFDSTSRASFYRQLPETVNYLSKRFTFVNEHDENLSGMRKLWEQRMQETGQKLNQNIERTNDVLIYEMTGATIVGDGTAANIAGLMSGVPIDTLPEARMRVTGTDYIDRWPMIWTNATNNGYVTLWAEDGPGIGAFTLRLKGYKKQPTDHYFRAYWLAHGRYTNAMRPVPKECLPNEPFYETMFNWAKQFQTKYEGLPKLSFLFTKMAHDNHNLLTQADTYLPGFFEDLYQSKVFENTAVVLFGDHGSRYGPLRETSQGKLEERLPLNMIFLPKWFQEKHPKLAENLYHNQNKMFTPFDMHATIHHIMQIPITEEFTNKKPHQMSLFERISENRTCSIAKVPSHWCMCQQWKNISVDDSVVINGTASLVEKINEILEQDGEGRCLYPLYLRNINWAQSLRMNEQAEAFLGTKDDFGTLAQFQKNMLKTNTYMVQVQFTTEPENTGTFEGTFQVTASVNTTIIEASTDFSRVDAYGKQECDPKPHVRQFCKCK